MGNEGQEDDGSLRQMLTDPEKAFKWDLTNWPAGGFGMHVGGAVAQAAKAHFPELADQFPFWDGADSKVLVADTFLCGSLRSTNGTRTAGDFSEAEIAELTAAAHKSNLGLDPADLVNALGPKWFSAERFTYIGPYRKPFGCWPHLLLHLDAWLKEMVIPQLLELNRRRVERAIPPPPSFNIEEIRNALWVLESASACLQGTAFNLEGYGMVTNAHTIADDTVAFRPDAPARKYRTSIVAKNDTIDLAVLKTEAPLGVALRPGDSDAVKLMDHVLLAGFPNYRLGDSGIVSPGLIIGFRPASAITRMLTNAGIVAGNSGGPVIGANGLVVGIAVTGATHPSEVHKTEDHGIIPVRALKFLT